MPPSTRRARTGTASGRLLLRPVEGRDGRQEDAKAEIDEVDVCDRERDVARDHDSLVEHAVDELDQRDLLRERQVGRHAAWPCSTKLYGGHGPVSRSSIPCPPTSCRRASNAFAKPAWPSTGTRYAPFSSIVSRRPLNSGGCGGFARASSDIEASRSWTSCVRSRTIAPVSAADRRACCLRNRYSRPVDGEPESSREASACSRNAFTPSSMRPCSRPSDETSSSPRSSSMRRTPSSSR